MGKECGGRGPQILMPTVRMKTVLKYIYTYNPYVH